MHRLLFDHDFNEHVILGLLRRQPDLDLARLREVGLKRASDATVLQWAAAERRVVVTHDVQTMIAAAFERVSAGLPMPGVLAVYQKTAIAAQIDGLLLVLTCLGPSELEHTVRFIPLQ